jgi:hypothetical protein
MLAAGAEGRSGRSARQRGKGREGSGVQLRDSLGTGVQTIGDHLLFGLSINTNTRDTFRRTGGRGAADLREDPVSHDCKPAALGHK